MANKSDWKGFEKMVAIALGGKRRFRTTENYGKEADDVKFPKSMRRQYPVLKRIAIECKKRKSLNVHAMFSEAKDKYCKEGKNLIFASKVTHKRNLEKRIKKMRVKMTRRNDGRKKPWSSKKLKLKIKVMENRIRARHDISALVTVELGFFKVLWDHWLGRDKESSDG